MKIRSKISLISRSETQTQVSSVSVTNPYQGVLHNVEKAAATYQFLQ